MKKIFLMSLTALCFLSANSLEQIKNSNTIRIGVATATPPLGQVDRNGNFSGFEIELAQEIGKAIVPGGKIELIGVSNADRLSAVQNNRVDLLINNYARTARRAEVIDYTIPYLSLSLSAVSKKGGAISSEADFTNRKILVIPESNSEIYLKNKGIETVSCKNNMDCFQKLSSGQGDAYMHNILNVAVIPLLDPNYEVTVKTIGPILFDCAATQKGNTALVNAVNEKILSLAKEGFFAKAYNNTFANFYKGTVDKNYFLLEDVYATLGL